MLARVLVVGSFLVAAVVIYAIVDIAATPSTRVRGLPKPLWFAAVVLFPLIGAVLWFVLGRPRKSPRSPAGPPIDVVDRGNPSGGMPSESVDERIARLEEELRRLDDEDDIPPKATE